MTFRPDRTLLALAVALLAIGGPLSAASGEQAIQDAIAALERGDGVAAEMAGKRALEQGAARSAVAAYIGEGELLQGDLRDARTWLEGEQFDGATRDRGLHALATVEMAEGDFDAAAAAFARLLADSPGNALIWTDLAKLRYSIGEHHGALDAARQAAILDPHEPRAVEFLALLVRDGQGLGAALPLLRESLAIAPDDPGLLEQYAAALGDYGRHRQMLAVIRHLLDVAPDNTRAFLLQAILAARSGEDDLARRLLWRTGDVYSGSAVGLLLAGVLEYRAGNFALAVEEFDDLRRLQPLNETALLLQARAHLANGEANEAVALLESRAQRPDASNYVLTLIARAHEQLGEREEAAAWLDRAAALAPPSIRAMPAYLPRDGQGHAMAGGPPVLELREMLAEGRFADAQALSRSFGDRFPGSADILLMRGDVELLAGAPKRALVQYRSAAVIRRNYPLMLRMVAAMQASGDDDAARRLLAGYLAGNPRDRAAAALLGRLQARAGNPARATGLLRHAAALGGGGYDPLLLADLASLELRLGNGERAGMVAARAHALQRANRGVALALARVLEIGGDSPALQRALLAKAHRSGASELAAR